MRAMIKCWRCFKEWSEHLGTTCPRCGASN